jgi:hypothetical protein
LGGCGNRTQVVIASCRHSVLNVEAPSVHAALRSRRVLVCTGVDSMRGFLLLSSNTQSRWSAARSNETTVLMSCHRPVFTKPARCHIQRIRYVSESSRSQYLC